MKNKAGWLKLTRYIAIVMVLVLAGTGAALASSDATTTKADSATGGSLVLDGDLLSVEDEAESTEEKQEADEIDADKPAIGVMVSNMNPASYAVVKGILPVGAYITEVEVDSPASVAGLQVGDIVVEMDGMEITAITQMANLLQEKEAGDTVAVKIFRVEGIESAQSYSELGEGEFLDLTVELVLLDKTAS